MYSVHFKIYCLNIHRKLKFDIFVPIPQFYGPRCMFTLYIIIIINNQPTVNESCPDGNGTLNSRVELQPLTRVCVGLMDHIGFEFFLNSVCKPDM